MTTQEEKEGGRGEEELTQKSSNPNLKGGEIAFADSGRLSTGARARFLRVSVYVLPSLRPN